MDSHKQDFDQLLTAEKLNYFKFFMQHGFDFDKSTFKDKSAPFESLEEMKNFLDYIKDRDFSETFWMRLMKESRSYSVKHHSPVLSKLMEERSDQYPADSEYHQVYRIISQMLNGEFPKITELSGKATVLLLLLMEDLKTLSSERTICDNLMATPVHNQASVEQPGNTLELLRALFRFQKIELATNPLLITPEANKIMFERLFNQSDGDSDS